ncbi:MAG: pantetheine-phosphate adenylyltransferase [Pelagibacterales bacterium]|nr:pantetheine-phosphate adenylyltransferase [Pelagibacterales bacterium]PPR16023.1 MAG: Phosphopantetheine adenylyltransferase [Alphaproteobacteria bacterium MarineAlpha9_Bin3]
MTKKIGLYPGSFDPITNGHMDIIKRSLKVVDKLVIGIAVNVGKTGLFSLEERENLVSLDIKNLGLEEFVEVRSFEGLLVNYAKKIDAKLIVRGLRAVTDFEYEFQMTGMNARLDSNIETVFLMASENQQFISSRLVKEIFTFGGDISSFVSANVLKEMKIQQNNNN